MKITVLTENTTSSPHFGAEHGLSLLVKTGDKTILFDTGQSDLFFENAKKLGISLDSVDFAVISHGHYDHTGGIGKFLKENTEAPVFINPLAFGEYYNGTEKYIGMEKALCGNPRFILTDMVHHISPHITLYRAEDTPTPFPLSSGGLNEKSKGEFVPDTFLHEQYLLIEEKGRRILLSGCSHRGIMNIAAAFKPDVLIGGFHLSKFPLGDDLKSAAEYLDSFQTDFYTCHCTGEAQFEFMSQYMKNLHYIRSGDSFTI